MAAVNIFKNYQHFEEFPAGQVIFEEGQPGNLMYVVKEGEVDIFMNSFRLFAQKKSKVQKNGL